MKTVAVARAVGEVNEACKKITIIIRGQTEADLEDAFNEAARHVREGYVAGHNSNDTGAYYFEVTEAVPEQEWPA